jgi:hypothetical protein
MTSNTKIIGITTISFFGFLGWGETVHLVLWPLTGLLYLPRMIVSVKQSVEWELLGETEALW